MARYDKSQMDSNLGVRGSFQGYLNSFNATIGNAGGALKHFSPETMAFCEWLMKKGTGPILIFCWFGDVEITEGEAVEIDCPSFEQGVEVRKRFWNEFKERWPDKRLRFSHRGFLVRSRDDDTRDYLNDYLRYGKTSDTKETLERHLRNVKKVGPPTVEKAAQFGIYIPNDRIDPTLIARSA